MQIPRRSTKRVTTHRVLRHTISERPGAEIYNIATAETNKKNAYNKSTIMYRSTMDEAKKHQIPNINQAGDDTTGAEVYNITTEEVDKKHKNEKSSLVYPSTTDKSKN